MILLFITMFLLFVLGVPLAISIGISSLVWLLFNEVALNIMVQRMFDGIDSFPILAVPLFILAGEIMGRGGITDRLVKLSNTLVGSIRGALAHVNIMVSMFFAGMTGAATADTSAVGSLLIPAMIKEGYGKDITVAVTATSSVIGVIIPPSIPLIIFGLLSGVSIGKLLLAGIIPGVLLGLALMIVTYIIAVKRNLPYYKRPSFEEFMKAVLGSILPLLTIIIIIVGIYSGVFTPTEAGAVAALYSLFLVTTVYKTVKISDLFSIFKRAGFTSGIALFLLANSFMFSWIIAYERIPQIVADAIFSFTTNKIIILLLINAALLIVGTFMDCLCAIIIFAPLLMKLLTTIGLDPIHIGMILILNLSIGMATPPVGVCLFIGCTIAETNLSDVIKALFPYLLASIAVLMLITFLPQLTLIIPNMIK